MYMKKLFTLITLLSALLVASCNKYDDTLIWQEIDSLKDRVTAVEALLKASANDLTIVSVDETDDGFVITFSDDSKVIINNKVNGDSHIVNIEEDGDMVYITLDDGTILTFRKYELEESCKVYYTTTDDKMLLCDSGFGAILISSTFENGQGLLLFDKPVTGGGAWNGMEDLESIVLPPSVETTGSFYECTGLKKLYCKATTPPAASSHFLSYYKYGTGQPYQPIHCTIYVPTESVELYKSAEYWSVHKDRIVGYDFENDVVVE